jgi:hypothetical protein
VCVPTRTSHELGALRVSFFIKPPKPVAIVKSRLVG